MQSKQTEGKKIKTRMEINEIVNVKTLESINKTKSCFFEEILKVAKL